VGVVPQLLSPGENGLVVERTVDDFVHALCRVRTWNLEDREVACRRVAESRSIEVMAEAWRGAIEAALEYVPT
jgi:glycosyltransferase involved in cell wall biosynthesis